MKAKDITDRWLKGDLSVIEIFKYKPKMSEIAALAI